MPAHPRFSLDVAYDGCTLTSHVTSRRAFGNTLQPRIRGTSANRVTNCKISGSHGGMYEDDCLKGCCAVALG
jgi:hypothetical protein